MIDVRVSCTQLGLAIDARRTPTDPWITVEIQPYRTYPAPSVCAYAGAIDPARQRREYLETLSTRPGGPYRLVMEE